MKERKRQTTTCNNLYGRSEQCIETPSRSSPTPFGDLMVVANVSASDVAVVALDSGSRIEDIALEGPYKETEKVKKAWWIWKRC